VLTGLASAGSGQTINLVAFSTPKPVMQQLTPKFVATPAGAGDTFNESYGPSSSQAKAIIAGQPADVAFLSNALDVDSLVDNNLVVQNWTKVLPAGGIVADSVVAFVVRPGNPKNIRSWASLIKSGVQIITPDPFPSGGAKWNVLAAYGAQRKMGKTDKQATAYVKKMFYNVVQQDTSASNSMATFLSGKGDVILTYESEAYSAVAKGQLDANQIIVPKQTMTIQLPMVPIKGAVTDALKFIDYCHTAGAQSIFTKGGYRPVVKSVLNDPSNATWKQRYTSGSHVYLQISNSYFGGWRKANSVWFSQNGRMVKIEQAVGGPTS
jgi:sulfate transport system substrate-binding protein